MVKRFGGIPKKLAGQFPGSLKNEVFKMMKKIKGVVVATVSAAALPAFAVGPDFSGMTSQIDWTTATAAVLLVAGGLAALYVVFTGSGLINSKIKGGK